MRKPSGVSESVPRALFLSPELPYPTIGGGALRSASVLEYLRQHYTVDAIFFQERGRPDTPLPPGRIERFETIPLPYHSRHPMARAFRNAGRLLRNRPPLLDRFAGFDRSVASFVTGHTYDLAVVEHFWCAPYLDALRPRCKNVWINLHNIESVWHRRLAEQSPWAQGIAHQRFAQTYSALEKFWLPKFDTILVTSEVDAGQVRCISPTSNVIVYPNALPSVPLIDKHEDDTIAFSGNLEYEPNQAAVMFFLNRVWPMIREQWPALKFIIIGRNPQALRNVVVDQPGVELIGAVEDAIASLATTKAAVVPVLAGSGTRIKILEAWAAATPVVSTTVGAEGLDCRDGEHLLLADEPHQFAEKVSELLASPDRRIELGQAGHKLCEERYTWTAAWRRLDAIRR